MKIALVIDPSGETIKIDIATASLGKLQAAVGGYVQAIDLADNLTMWCNEEGKLVGLDHNPAAQLLFDKAFGAGLDTIVGSVVLTGGTDSKGETLGLTDGQVDDAAWLALDLAL